MDELRFFQGRKLKKQFYFKNHGLSVICGGCVRSQRCQFWALLLYVRCIRAFWSHTVFYAFHAFKTRKIYSPEYVYKPNVSAEVEGVSPKTGGSMRI